MTRSLRTLLLGVAALAVAAGAAACGTQRISIARSNPAYSTDYAAATATVSLVVAQATPAITWPTPSGIVYGTGLGPAQLDATASVPDPVSTVSWNA